MCEKETSQEIFRRNVLNGVREKIRAGVDVNKKDEYGNNILLINLLSSAPSLLSEVLKILIEAGLDINSQNNKGETILIHKMKTYGVLEVNSAFYDYYDIYIRNKQEYFLDFFQSLINFGADVNIADNNGHTPLTYRVTAIESLRSSGIHHGGGIEARRCTFLKKLFFMIMEAGAIVDNNVYIKGCYGDETTLLNAVCTNKLGFDLNEKGDVTGCWFAAYDTASMVSALIKAGVDVNLKGRLGHTALHEAMHLDLEVVSILLEAGADVNVKGYEGRTALNEFCIHHKDISKISALVKAGTDLNSRDNKGRTALMQVVMHSDHNTALKNVSFLIDAGADANIADNNGRTALMMASTEEIQFALIEAGADINAKDNDGKNVLVYACGGKIISYLSKTGLDVNAKDKKGKTALMYKNSEEAALALIKAGADVNARDN